MKSISIKESWKNKLDKASNEWKAGAARTKFKSTVLAFLMNQRESPEPGLKNCAGKPCVPVPKKLLCTIYGENASRMKFIETCEKHGLVVRDRSWISPAFSIKVGEPARCDRWHFTEPEASGKLVEEHYDTSAGLCAKYADWLRKADSMKWGLDEFRGVWAVEAYNKGELGWKDYVECAIVAKVILEKGFEDGTHEYREYTPLAMCPKHLRGKCFVRSSTGDGMVEFFDLNACITFCAPVGASIVANIGYTDVLVKNYFYRLKMGDFGDAYKKIYDRMNKMDPHHDWYGSKGVWTDAVRKKLKTDVQVVFNETMEWVDQCEKAYKCEIPDIKWWDSRRRRWLVWRALRETYYDCWLVSLATKINGKKGGFFRIYSAAEKCIFGVIRELLTEQGYEVHRLHDSIWTSDPRLRGMSEKGARMMVGKMFLDWMREQEKDIDWLEQVYWRFKEEDKNHKWHIRRMGKQRLTESEIHGMRESLKLGEKFEEYSRRIREAKEWGKKDAVPA